MKEVQLNFVLETRLTPNIHLLNINEQENVQTHNHVRMQTWSSNNVKPVAHYSLASFEEDVCDWIYK